MIKIIISGCNGHMGKVMTEMFAANAKTKVVAGFEMNTVKLSDYPVYADPKEYTGTADCVVDFSSPAALSGLLSYCVATKTPLVLCTTGHSEEQLEAVRAASEQIPIFRSGNMSLGINVMIDLIKRATALLGDNYDVELLERHHRRKVDAPSGTALMLADAANAALPYDAEYVFERQSVRQSRGDHEIGISSVRGGTIVGEHEIIFAGRDEVLTISHSAYSREVFATGALRAAIYLSGAQKAGMYSMSDLVAEG